MSNDSTALAVSDQPTAPATVQPLTANQMIGAMSAYREIQAAIDAANPDCILDISGKQFRKKSYWRAVSTAFRLSVEITDEREYTDDGGGRHYLATARATAPDGRTATGDGSCSASEKSGRMLTLHNVRAHACTRAKNRAISDLVGFGEVSAEELRGGQWDDQTPKSAPHRPAAARAPSAANHPGHSHHTRNDLVCPKCGKPAEDRITERVNGGNRPAVGCSDWKNCDFAIWSASEAMGTIETMSASTNQFDDGL